MNSRRDRLRAKARKPGLEPTLRSGAAARKTRKKLSAKTVRKCVVGQLAAFLSQAPNRIHFEGPLNAGTTVRGSGLPQDYYQPAVGAARNIDDLLFHGLLIWPSHQDFKPIHRRQIRSWLEELRWYFDHLLMGLLYHSNAIFRKS